jgi:hypothetical protein
VTPRFLLTHGCLCFRVTPRFLLNHGCLSYLFSLFCPFFLV